MKAGNHSKASEQREHHVREDTTGAVEIDAKKGVCAGGRDRHVIEHRLAHLSQRKGKRARYRGIRNNHFDLRRHSALLNFEVIANRLNGR